MELVFHNIKTKHKFTHGGVMHRVSLKVQASLARAVGKTHFIPIRGTGCRIHIDSEYSCTGKKSFCTKCAKRSEVKYINKLKERKLCQ